MQSLPLIRKVLLGLVIPAIIIVIGHTAQKKLASMRKKPQKKIEKIAPLVEVMEVLKKDIPVVVKGYGKVRPTRSAILTSEVEGIAHQVLSRLKAGYFVKKGELLAQINPINYELKVNKLEAGVQKLEVGILHLEQEKKNIERRIRILQQSLKLAETQRERSFDLRKSGAASDQIWDQDRLSYLEQSSRLVELQNQYSLIPLRIQETQAELKSTQAELSQAKVDLQRTFIKAPFAARVKSANLEEGEMVRVGSSLAVLDDYNLVEIPVMLSKEDFYKIGLNAQDIREIHYQEKEVRAKVYTTMGEETFFWPGRVIRVEPMNEAARTIPIIVAVENPWGDDSKVGDYQEKRKPILMSGMFCSVEITGETIKDTITIPRASIHENNLVYLAKESKLFIQEIQINYRFGDEIIIKSGLDSGDKIIMTPILFPVSGIELQISEEKKP